MKFALKTLAIVLLAAAPSAFAALGDTASDGTVHITGTIKQNACTVKTSSVEVTLKDEFASIFTTAGQTQGDKEFTIDLEHCDASVYPNVQARFEGVTDAYGTNVLKNNGTATNVGVQIVDSASSAITFNDESQWSAATTIPAGGDTEVSIPFTARYIATTASVGAGSVDSTATFYLQYN
ncbi:fimbrial protein StiA [Superficieibacter electus]|uniref:Fimbrial protein StiA n=1 Tax=Superficieibacter electus TaxID=2022662 RepID=A0A2P5GMI0_9ENTR|nr:fimbrial protein [Superficieibacter electus]POP41997.1 fimbrial protein StiA [Superficieibacter electus]POP47003.1 fimbrial protein StiA [Superficieibacter electus]